METFQTNEPTILLKIHHLILTKSAQFITWQQNQHQWTQGLFLTFSSSGSSYINSLILLSSLNTSFNMILLKKIFHDNTKHSCRKWDHSLAWLLLLFSDQWCTQNLLGYSNVTVFSQRALWVGASCKNCHMAFKSLQFTFTTFSSSFHAVMNIILFKCSYVNNKVKHFPSFLFFFNCYLAVAWQPIHLGNPFTWC